MSIQSRKPALKAVVVAAMVIQAGMPWPALADEVPLRRYSIRQEQAPIGSNIKRAAVTAGIPLDKPYARLTREQKEMLRSQYEGMAEGDEPPFPLEGLAAFYKPLYEALGYASPATGWLVLHISVDSQGEATSVQVLASPSADVTKIAATLAMLVKYKPGLCGGTPCEMAIPLEIELRR